MTTAVGELSASVLDTWASDPAGPIALHLKQRLLPVGDEVIFPPTYADIGYNIDTLSDGTMVATIDSVGSQANRIEPIFKADSGERADWFVPQLEIELRDGVRRSILDLAHRGADAVVRASTLAGEIEKAFQALQKGDAGPLCAIAPTSLVFGVWDSRGTFEKRPRLVRAIIRAWDVEPLRASAQFNSVWKTLDQTQRSDLDKEAKARKVRLSEKGFQDAPASGLGGILVHGRIERDVTVDLIALRNLSGSGPDETIHIQQYVLGLSLMAATTDLDLSLRQGCLLRYADEDAWHAVPRRGEPQAVDLSSDHSLAVIKSYARNAARHFRDRWPKEPVHKFDIQKAKALLAQKDNEDAPSEV